MEGANYRRDAGIGVSFFISATMHVAVFLLLTLWGDLFPARMLPETTYYVDIVNVPVASPKSLPPGGGVNESAGAFPSLPEPEMMAPLSEKSSNDPKQFPPQKTVPDNGDKSAESEDEFKKRMSRIQSYAESKEQDARIDRLRQRVAVGVAPGGSRGSVSGRGSEAGSDYLGYITSRLTDSFKEPPNVAKSLFTEIRLRINAAGKVELLEITRSSGNLAFDNYAKRSVYDAEGKFTPPPQGKFEFTFRFRPQGISLK